MLQGHSGPSLSRRALEDSGGNVSFGLTAAHDALDETFLLITPAAVFVWFDPVAAPLIEPHLFFWLSGGLGLRFASGGEDRKMFEFKAAVHSLLPAGARLGTWFTGATADIERWPLVAAFALEVPSPAKEEDVNFPPSVFSFAH